MCRDTRGVIPVYRWTWAASESFSKGSRGVPGLPNTLKRVPEFPNAHEGSSMVWVRNAESTRSRVGPVIVMVAPTPSSSSAVTQEDRTPTLTRFHKKVPRAVAGRSRGGRADA